MEFKPFIVPVCVVLLERHLNLRDVQAKIIVTQHGGEKDYFKVTLTVGCSHFKARANSRKDLIAAMLLAARRWKEYGSHGPAANELISKLLIEDNDRLLEANNGYFSK